MEEEDVENATQNWRTGRDNPRATSSSRTTKDGGPDDAKDAAACRSCVELLRDAVLNHRRGSGISGGGGGSGSGSGSPSPQSKPYQLLQSLLQQEGSAPARQATTTPPAPLVVQLTPEGLQVQIPAEDPRIPKRRWSRLPPETQQVLSISTPSPVVDKGSSVLTTNLEKGSSTTTSNTATAPAVGLTTVTLQRLATSARSAAAATPTTPGTSSHEQQQQQQLEWLQLSCRKCSETGPEGGARAFVMGPQPLSVVVCHNRLQHLPPPPPSQSQMPSPLAISAAWSSTRNRDDQQRQQQQQQQQQQQLRLDEMDEILTHELTHVYDVRRLHLDLRDCENLAYSEVRAARAAECAPSPPSQQQHASSSSNAMAAAPWYYAPAASLSMRAQRSCVKHKAVTATHNLFPQHASACLSKVFDAAWADRRPWNYNTGGTGTGAGSGGGAPPPPPVVPPKASSSR